MSIAPLDTAAKPRTGAADTVSLSIDKSASSAARVAISSSYTSAVNRGVLPLPWVPTTGADPSLSLQMGWLAFGVGVVAGGRRSHEEHRRR